jgi:uncharacterized protein (DUF2267 family)
MIASVIVAVVARPPRWRENPARAQRSEDSFAFQVRNHGGIEATVRRAIREELREAGLKRAAGTGR